MTYQDILQLKRDRKELFEKAQKVRTEAREANDESMETANKISAMLNEIDDLTLRIQGAEMELSAEDAAKEWQTSNASARFTDTSGAELRTFTAGRRTPETDLDLGKILRGTATNNWTGADAEAAMVRAIGYDSGGGLAVPLSVSREIWRLITNSASVTAAGAHVLEAQHANLRVAVVDEITGVDWYPEHEEIVSSGSLRSVDLILKKAAGLLTMSLEIIQDAPNLDRALADALVAKLREVIDQGALSGSGAEGQPVGLLNWKTAAQNPLPTDDLEAAVISNRLVIEGFYRLLANNCPADGVTAIMHPLVLSALDTEAAESTFVSGRPRALDQFRILPSTAMPADKILIGRFQDAIIGTNGPVHLQWLQERAMDRYQKQLVAALRFDVAPIVPTSFRILENFALSD